MCIANVVRYPIAIEAGDANHSYGAVVRDLPGCFSAGDSLDEAMTNAQETILLHLKGLPDDGEPVSEPNSVERLRNKRALRHWAWAIVDIDYESAG